MVVVNHDVYYWETEHTLLVTDTGVEVLTARSASSPGGPVLIPQGNDSEAVY
jgi:hypothetical protein